MSTAPDDAHLRRLIVTTLQTRRSLAAGMHPDPPRRPVDPPLRVGLRNPCAAAVWLWGFLDFNGSTRGVAMYAFCAAVTGERFLGAYERGDSIPDEIDRRLRSSVWIRDHPAAAQSNTFFDAHGGFRRCMLELAATAFAVVRPPMRPSPPGLGHHMEFSDNPRDAWVLAHLVTHSRERSVDAALEDLAHLLGEGSGRLWRSVRREYGRLQRIVSPELIVPAARPAACVLACAMPFALRVRHDPTPLERFAKRLPEALLVGATIHAHRLFARDTDDKERVQALGGRLYVWPTRTLALEAFVSVLREAADAAGA